MRFVEDCVDAHDLSRRSTLEVGSRNINGSPRGLFSGAYLGVDMLPGDGVDLVARADHLPFPEGAFGCVVSTEMLEHDPYPWLSIKEMARVLAPGGYLILTARGIGFPLHAYPDDYWRFTQSGFRKLLEIASLVEVRVEDDPEAPGVLCLARKP